jgi:uncharacterized protein YhaN
MRGKLLKIAVVVLLIVALAEGAGAGTLYQKATALKHQVTQLEKQINELSTQERKCNQEREQYKTLIDELNKKIADLEKQNKEISQERDKLQSEKKELEEKCRLLESQIAQLKEGRVKEEKKEVKAKTIKLVPPIFLITGRNRVEEFKTFYGEISSRVYTIGVGGYELKEGIGLRKTSEYNTFIVVIPPTSSALEEYQEGARKYPELFPLSAEEVKELIRKYPLPVLYFSQKTKIVGVIVTPRLTEELVKPLLNGVILEVPFQYKEGKISVLE